MSSARQRAGSARPHGGVREQRGDRRGVGRAAAVAEREQPAAGAEALRHRRRRAPRRARLALERRDRERRAVGGLGHRRVGEVGEQRRHVRRARRRGTGTGSRSSVYSATTAIAVPAWTRTRSPTATGATSAVSTVSMPAAERTLASPSRFDRQHLGRPSLVGAGDAAPAPASSAGGSTTPGCSKQTWVSSHSRWYSLTTEPSWRAAPGCGRVSPQHVVGDAGGWARAGADPDGRQPPGLGPAQQARWHRSCRRRRGTPARPRLPTRSAARRSDRRVDRDGRAGPACRRSPGGRTRRRRGGRAPSSAARRTTSSPRRRTAGRGRGRRTRGPRRGPRSIARGAAVRRRGVLVRVAHVRPLGSRTPGRLGILRAESRGP